MAENYNLIFGSNASQTYSWSDADYQTGWETVGDTPPTAQQFDALQNRADKKAQELNNRMIPLETAIGAYERQPSTGYSSGVAVLATGLNLPFYLECTTAGTTGAGDIAIPSTPSAGTTISDGTVVWTIRKLVNSANTSGYITKDVTNLTYYKKKVDTPAFNTRAEITTSGTWTAPVTGWYKITLKGGGGGGAGSAKTSTNYHAIAGGGGGEGGTTIAYKYINSGQSIPVTIGGGGTGGNTNSSGGAVLQGSNGGNSSVTINGDTIIAYGGTAAASGGGNGGDGTIVGCCGSSGSVNNSTSMTYSLMGGTGGGNGGAHANSGGTPASAKFGGGGAGGSVKLVSSTLTLYKGGTGGDGYVWFEYWSN
jgi:hypothetical protein